MPLKTTNSVNGKNVAPKKIRFEFDAIIQKHPTLNAFYVNFNCDIQRDFGAKQAKIKVWFDGYLYRGLLKRIGGKHMEQIINSKSPYRDEKNGSECGNKFGENDFILLINKDVRKAINKNAGDSVCVVVEKDDDERVVVISGFMQDELITHDALEQFKKLCFTSQKEWAKKIDGAKKIETKERMLLRLLEIL